MKNHPSRRHFLFKAVIPAAAAMSLPRGLFADGPAASPSTGGNFDVNGGGGAKGPDGKIRKIALGPDDKPAFPVPPVGFDVKRDGIPHGKMELIEYDSKSIGTRRKMNVYTPPTYGDGKRYPVLYLLHGIGGDETEWAHYALPNIILDNLLADGKAGPMILVMPNGRGAVNDRPPRNLFTPAHSQEFADFEKDLFGDVIPSIDARYTTLADREHRALAGLSMGGGQALNFGLSHLDQFAWVGAFSPAPDTKPPDQLIADPAAAKAQLKLLWLSAGDRDGLISIAQGVHAWLKANGIPHIWHVDDNAHDTPEWRSSFYHFAPLVFA
jgi:enterochelin esterase-like enzyme